MADTDLCGAASTRELKAELWTKDRAALRRRHGGCLLKIAQVAPLYEAVPSRLLAQLTGASSQTLPVPSPGEATMPYLVPPIAVPVLMILLILIYAAYRPPLADDPWWLSTARLSVPAVLTAAPDPGSTMGTQ
jgi:hypothetical protein